LAPPFPRVDLRKAGFAEWMPPQGASTALQGRSGIQVVVAAAG
jgi:hypothetical protein